MQEYSLTDFPHLQCLEYSGGSIPISEWKLPSLSHVVVKHASLDEHLPHAQLTSVDLTLGFSIMSYRTTESFTHALHRMTSLRELKLTVECHPEGYIRFDPTTNLEPRSVHIDVLHVTIKRLTDADDAQHIYSTLMHFSPKYVSLTLADLADSCPLAFFATREGNMFPYGSTIDIRVVQLLNPFEVWDYFPVLTSVIEDCNIAETVHVEIPAGVFVASEGEPDEWECYSSVRTLQFRGCRQLSELNEFADHLISPEEGKGLLSLEVYSCHGISGEFLEELKGTVGEKIRWTPR
ncbi:hypothetical protein BD410DRAFT_846949 [Rickenella mellea]|uniref:Uncharacterized protein n=1 Tax=Rickenella mellea TaxID=50990 RepID=A0A4Y7PDS9_9AGAM|nr:hypothetical protein BD410DRAFT_846949 [Rickenella mellea]